MRELKQLRLPQLVEARKRRASMNLESPNSPTTAHMLQSSQTSNATSTETTSPITPAYSPRGHGRFPSSTSSLASSPPLRDSLDGFTVGKRPLTEVREEPHEREEDFEMINGFTSSPPDRDSMYSLPPMSLPPSWIKLIEPQPIPSSKPWRPASPSVTPTSSRQPHTMISPTTIPPSPTSIPARRLRDAAAMISPLLASLNASDRECRPCRGDGDSERLATSASLRKNVPHAPIHPALHHWLIPSLTWTLSTVLFHQRRP